MNNPKKNWRAITIKLKIEKLMKELIRRGKIKIKLRTDDGVDQEGRDTDQNNIGGINEKRDPD